MGLYLSIRLRFIQIRKFSLAIKNTVGKIFDKSKAKEGSIAHACADTNEPVKQGFFGIFEVFADTIIICTLTAMVVLFCVFHDNWLGTLRCTLR